MTSFRIGAGRAHAGDAGGHGRELAAELLLLRLRGFGVLSPEEVDLVRTLAEAPRSHEPGTTISARDDAGPQSRLIVGGWACRPRILSDGRRQILGLLLPGDLVGDHGLHRPLSLNPVIALTTVRTVGVTRLFEQVRERASSYGGIARALAAMDRGEEMALLDHVVRLGCQNARQRFCHLMLELHARLSTIDFVHDGSFPMPLTQDVLGDLLGLSLVHINRIVSQLRREKLVTLQRGIVTIGDFARLALLADAPEATGMA